MTNPPWPLESEATLWPPARVATNSFQGGELDGRHDVGHPAASHDQPGARISEVAMEVSPERFR